MATVKVENLDRAAQSAGPGEWAQSSAPAATAQATATQAAPGAGKRNVVRSISATLCGNTTAPAATVATLNLINGATGGSVLMSWTISIPAVAGTFSSIQLTNLNIEMTANAQTTLEFSAGGGANTLESVNMTGHVRNVQITEP